MCRQQDILEQPLYHQSDFCSEKAKQSYRVTCYGSSSAKTPDMYLKAAKSVGYTLAKRGHTCINGAGGFGCMAAINDGGVEGDGNIIGVIHEMFLVDNGYFKSSENGQHRGNMGTHRAFNTAANNNCANQQEGPLRQILIARGDDLTERKRLLVENTDAILVLPGGPGTWDGKYPYNID